MFRSSPTRASDAPILTAVGGAETPVFFEQMEAFTQQWKTKSLQIERHVEPGADHFDIIERIGDSGSDIFKAIYQRLR